MLLTPGDEGDPKKEACKKGLTKQQQKKSLKNMAQIEDNLHREQSEWQTSSNSLTVAPFHPPISESAKSAESEEEGECWNAWKQLTLLITKNHRVWRA